jgi:hypothetical protein
MENRGLFLCRLPGLHLLRHERGRTEEAEPKNTTVERTH